tara:strand:- start:10183 stop:10344 length:162 start_codon:yes stop_codon:yes gene_type:complete
VKTDTASTWVVNWIGKQMIGIYQHGGHHYQIADLPPVTIESCGNTRRHQEMKK